MEYTGERVVPDAMPAEDPVLAEHLARYFFARGLLPAGARVLDAACGSGYGAAMLADRARQVVGIDLLPEAVAYAQRRYGSPLVQFQVMDCRDLAFGDGVFDAYICFETIEHLREQEDLVAEARRVLADGGLFIVSTPNRELYNLAYGRNHYHERELSAEQFRDLLRDHFEEVTLFGQRHPGLDRLVEQLQRELCESREALAELSRCVEHLQTTLDQCLATTARTDERLNRLFFSLLRSIVPGRLRGVLHAGLGHWIWPDSPGPVRETAGRPAPAAPEGVPECQSIPPVHQASASAPLVHSAVLARRVQQVEISPSGLERSLYVIAVCKKRGRRIARSRRRSERKSIYKPRGRSVRRESPPLSTPAPCLPSGGA